MGGSAATHSKLKPQSNNKNPQILSPQNPNHHHHHLLAAVSHFPTGSAVEVRTDEEDYKGVFFAATVVRSSPPPSKKKKGKRKKSSSKQQRRSNRIFVEYQNLLAREDGSEKLREYVVVSFVRPSPPLGSDSEGFEADDVVDAFYRDGWWTGVVKGVVGGGGKYVVTFQHPPDELEFARSELRVHWDWVDGSWVRPENQRLAALMFDEGRKVEVSFDREDCQETWFPATIKKDLGNGAYLVEYRADSKAERVKVDSLHLRPYPPLLKAKNYIVLEKVDAYFDSGWWGGVITKELENSRYNVFFKHMNLDKEFDQGDLRAHMDWKDGKWFTSSQLSQDVSIPSSDGGMQDRHTFENSSASTPTVPVNNLRDGKETLDGKTPAPLTPRNDDLQQLTPEISKTSQETSLTKRRQHLSDSRNALSHPLKKFKEGTGLGSNQQETHDGSIKETLRDFVSPVSENNVETTGKQTASGDRLSDSPSWGKRIRRRQRNVGGKINSTSNQKGSTQKSQVENPEIDVGGKEPDVVDNTAEDVPNEHTKKGLEIPIIIGLPCVEMGSPGSGKTRGRKSRVSSNKEIISEEKQQLHDSTIQKSKDNKLLEIGAVSEKRKRGRPRKIPTETIQPPATDDLNKKDADPQRIPEVEAIVMDTSPPNQEKMALNKDKPINGQFDPKDGKGIMSKRTSPRKRGEKVVKESIRLRENRVFKRGRKRNTGEKLAFQVQDSLGASGGKSTETNSTMEINNAVSEAPNSEFENEPLSKWIEMHSPSTVDGSRPSAVNAVDKCVENGEKQNDGDELEDVSDKQQESGTLTSGLVEQQNLPFVKNTSLWRTIESLEVFQKKPQNPHFQLLEQYMESSREGLAIGYMITFSRVVENTCKLQFDDPKSVTDEILEQLADLERHGFDVKAVQNRVAELLAVKDKEVRLVDEVKGLGDQISEHHGKKAKIEEKIKEINEKIRKLQEELSLVESDRAKEEGEIASLGDGRKEKEESIKNARQEFEGIVSSALW